MAGEIQNAFETATSTGLPGSTGPVGETPAPAVSPSAPAASAAEQLVEIKWNGKTEKVPYSQAIELAQKGYDYTQKMQDLARQREAFGGERDRYEKAIAEVRAFLQDKQRMRQYMAQLEGGGASASPAATPDPDAVVTAQDLEARLKAAKEELEGLTQRQIIETRQQLEVERLASAYANDLSTHIEGLKKLHPELRAIPKVDLLLKQEVREMRPRNLDEAKAMMKDVAQEQARQVRAYLDTERKTSAGAPAAASPLANGIEPRGGGQALPPAIARKFKGLDDPEFKAAVLQDIMGTGQGR